ncbi:type I pantothenate kinase [Flaviflagellibacter deserti]|uniref:Pantothenate kinase n=1 Tax=Flaviflagellibacter deserti TaxID=2267266 RepID=A0ABV9Z5Y2_9HYPH
MDALAGKPQSPYRVFSREEWAELRADTPMTLNADEIERLRSLDDPLDLMEVEQIYLPISRLLTLYVEATQGLFRATRAFLNTNGAKKVPYIIGIGGSVAVGKSTTARLLQALLRRWPNTPKVDLVTTDGFLFPNEVLAAEGLMQRKGFPESYDLPALLKFMSDIKAGKERVAAPVYSHLVYDVVPGAEIAVENPDILILEGLNVLQAGTKDVRAVPFVSDFFDFSIFIDAEENTIHDWYVDRFMHLRETAFRDPNSYFQRYASVPPSEAMALAEDLWGRINLPNLRENILPTRARASLIMRKGEDHRVEEVALRKL